MTATGNIALKVPYKEKDEAKSLGARWNPAGKHWYIPAGLDATPFEKWLDANHMISNQTTGSISKQTTELNQEALPEDTDMDVINAMLREAYEIDDDMNVV